MHARLFSGVALGCLIAAALPAATRELGGGLADHGVATPISQHRGTVATVDGAGRNIVLAWLMDHRGCYQLLLIDVQTGKAEEFPISFPLGDSPFASILSRAGRFYTHFGSHFLEFDPARRAFTCCRKTSPQMAMSMTEDDRGVIWSATYPQSGLASYDPQSGAFKDYGHLYKQDWAQYPRAVATDTAGWVYLGIGSTACQVVAFNPQSGKATPLVPEADRKHGFGSVYAATDGQVYGQACAGKDEPWYAFHAGRMTRLNQKPAAGPKPIVASSQGLFHARFPDGRLLKSCDLVERTLIVEDPVTKAAATVRFDYQSEGAHIMGVAVAPDGTLCGGTAFPMRFFSFNPQTDQWINRTAFGQWNTVARQGDRFFAGAYGHGVLLQWNPAADWIDTVAGKPCNPQHLAESAPSINRPHDLLACPDGRTLVLAGTPGYGYTGGGLLFWDRSTSQHVLRTHDELLPQQATMSLVALPQGKLLGGTTTSPGTGGQKRASQAELYLLDLQRKQIDWHAAVFPAAQTYTDLALGPDGLVWGFVDGRRFFVFDPQQKKVVHESETLAPFGPLATSQGPRVFVFAGRTMYVLFQRGIARVEPSGWKIEMLVKAPAAISAGGDFYAGRIYFACGSHLYSFRPPEE